MGHSTREIESALRTAVKNAIRDGKEGLITVRYIRDQTQKDMELEEGFFVTEAWKAKSKQLIQRYANELFPPPESSPEATTRAKPIKQVAGPVKQAPKRAAQGDKSRSAKRRKKEATPPSDEDEELSEEPSEVSDEEEESMASEFDDSEASEVPKSKKKTRTKSKAPPKRQTKKRAFDSDESEDEDISEILSRTEESDAASTPPKKKAIPKNSKKGKDINIKRKNKEVVDSDVDSEDETPKKKAVGASKRKSSDAVVDSDAESENGEPTKKKPISLEKAKSSSLPLSKSAVAELDNEEEKRVDTKANDSDSSEMSIVLDEPPKPKKSVRKAKSDGSSTKHLKPKAAPKAAKEISPNEMQIKTLQSQLAKCGVRKIWAFELKQYGEDSKAKIRHLQSMLKETGMVGRFSEQRAKEIKESRELLADLEAVKEGERSWGLEGGRRNRGKRKSLKESSVEDDENEDGHADSDRVSRSPDKASKAKQELAFLGDEESDSDD